MSYKTLQTLLIEWMKDNPTEGRIAQASFIEDHVKATAMKSKSVAIPILRKSQETIADANMRVDCICSC